MNRSLTVTLFLLFGLTIAICSPQARAAELLPRQKTAAEMLPGSTLVYVELSEPKVLLDMVLDHPLRERIEKIDQVRNAIQGAQYQQFLAIVGMVEQQIGMKWNEAVGALTQGGISIAFDPKTDGAAMMLRARDEETLEKLRDTFFKLARNEAQRQGQPDPIKSTEYRGIKAYSLDKAKFVTLGSMLVLVNNNELGKAILNSYLDGDRNSLANNKQFREARNTITGKPSSWGYVDIATVRNANPDSDVYKQKSNNVLLELLVGGLMGTAKNTPYLAGSLDTRKERLALNLSAPHDPAWAGAEREYFFGPGGKGAAPPLLEPKGSLLSISTYRDFAGMWLNSADIFTDNVDDGFAKANATLATLFSGKDFGEEVLGAFKPEVQIVAARQTFEENRPIPAIKIPSFAFIFRFKETEKVQADFRRMFQSLIGFLNIIGAQNGQPQLDQDMEKGDDYQLLTASYAPESDKKISEQDKINFNFSPSVAFSGETFVVSSTKQLALELVKLVTKSQSSDKQQENGFIANTQLNTNLSAVRDAVNDNRKHLVTQTILSDGKERDEAEKQVDLILEAIGAFKNLNLHLDTSKDTVQFELEVNLEK